MIPSIDCQSLRNALHEFRKYDKAGYSLSIWETAIQAYEAANDPSLTPRFADFTESPYPYPYLPISPNMYGVDLAEDSAVLDIGCLAGYGLFDLTWRRQREGLPIPSLIGVDTQEASVEIGSRLTEHWASGLSVSFVKASAESLPLPDESVDMVIARLLLPYVRIEQTLNEVVRVLRHNGLALFQIHGPQYYIQQLRRYIKQPKRCAYFVRPLLSGAIFKVLRFQPTSRWLAEAALSLPTLDRLMASRACSQVWDADLRVRPMALYQKDQSILTARSIDRKTDFRDFGLRTARH